MCHSTTNHIRYIHLIVFVVVADQYDVASALNYCRYIIIGLLLSHAEYHLHGCDALYKINILDLRL